MLTGSINQSGSATGQWGHSTMTNRYSLMETHITRRCVSKPELRKHSYVHTYFRFFRVIIIDNKYLIIPNNVAIQRMQRMLLLIWHLISKLFFTLHPITLSLVNTWQIIKMRGPSQLISTIGSCSSSALQLFSSMVKAWVIGQADKRCSTLLLSSAGLIYETTDWVLNSVII